MRYFEYRLPKEPLVQLMKEVGVAGVMKQTNLDRDAVLSELQRLKYLYDSEDFAGNELIISNKDGNLVPLRYNFGQRKIMEAKERQLIANKPVRICLLKARQFGGSTLEEGDVFRECLLRTNRSCMIIAHDLDSARHLREMSSRFYDNYTLEKPRIKKETEKWWKFMHYKDGKSMTSHLRIDTAEELSTGHSLTLHHLHLSEIQNWRNASVLVRGLFPTVPKNPDTTIFMEGTGSGVGDYWYDFCQMAQSPDSGWEFVFVPWFQIEEYSLKFDNLDKRNDFEAKLDETERLLYKQGVGLEQLCWRRDSIKNTYKGDMDAFCQQYPATADEAFLTSGRPVFSPIKVKDAMLRSKEPKTGNLEYKDNKIVFIEQERGLWEVWAEPQDIENLYCCGVDVAEGIAVQPELGNKGGDFSCVKVLNRKTRKFEGKLHARIDPDLLSKEIEKGAKYWKYGVLVENNPGGSGNVVIRDLKDKPLNLLKTITLDRVHDTRKEQYGWDTNKESKREMIDELNEQIREERFFDPSRNFWYEASTYIKDEKGITNAQSKKYDDEVVANAVCLQADKLMPMVFHPKDEKKIFYDRGMDVRENWQKRNFDTSQSELMEKMYAEY